MTLSIVEYNGFRFSDRSHITVNEEEVYDDAQRTVVSTKMHIRVETIIVASDVLKGVGADMHRLRQRLSKAGQNLLIQHDGFAPMLNINGSSVKDVAFGPKPKIISWNPVGHTNAVEVIWECETCIPICNGDGNVRFSGVMAFNYAIGYSINEKGFTTRHISGYLEIAMTRIRGTRKIPDTADAYREKLFFHKPDNFHRTSDFNLSADKRRLDFTVIDTEIESRAPYAPGVVKIAARHRMRWGVKLGNTPQTLAVSIELEHHVTKARAWEIFVHIFRDRVKNREGRPVFVDDLQITTDVLGGAVDFELSYRMYKNKETETIAHAINASGVLLDAEYPWTWADWAYSMQKAHSWRGLAHIKHNPKDDKIIDLCSHESIDRREEEDKAIYRGNFEIPTLCNERPNPEESWLRFDASLDWIEGRKNVMQVQLGKDDLEDEEFNPNNPFGKMPSQNGNIKRFIETVSPSMHWVWTGIADRVGYDIPKPGKLKIGKVTLIPTGKANFRKRLIGHYFCQPLYRAAWKQAYYVTSVASSFDSKEAEPFDDE